jgi:hypothetical protein
MKLDNRSVELYELAALTVKLRTAIRYSLAQSLAAYFPPSEEPPPELRALLDRLDEP